MLQVPSITPAVWVYTTEPQYNAWRSAGYGSFLTEDQQARLERLRQARLLFDGKHRKYFIDEGRTQFEFPPMRSTGVWGEKMTQTYLTLNLLKLISLKNADLMFGETPQLRVVADPDEGDGEAALVVNENTQREYLRQLAERCNLHSIFHTKAVDCSYEGEAFLECCVEDGQVCVEPADASEIFPIGKMGPDHQYRQYQRLLIKNIGTKEQPIYLLLKILYLPGSIERHLYQLDDNGRPMPQELRLDQWPLEVGESPLVPVTMTGIDQITITYIPNSVVRGDVVSDYDGLIDLQDQLNSKQTQIARVLAKHSDPKLAAPSRMANEQGGARAGYDVYFFDEEKEIPRYIVWNSELAHALTDRDFVREHLLVTAEVSPVLLGIQKQSSRAASYKAIRLESYNSLTRAQRKAMYWKPGIRRALTIAQMLENTLPGVRYPVGPIAVELKDGIPIDEIDQANRHSILRSAGTMSVKRSVTEQLVDPAAVQEELDELEREAEKSQPVFAPPSVGPEGVEGKPGEGGAGDETADAAAAEAQQTEVAA